MLSLFNRKPYRNIEKSLGKYNLVLKNDLNLSIRVRYNGRLYTTYVEELEGREVVFRCPTDTYEIIRFKENSIIKIEFITSDSLYITELLITNKIVRGQIVYYRGEINSPIIENQRRKSYRLPLVLDVTYTILPAESDKYKGNTLDVSSGGILMETEENIKSKDIRVFFNIEGQAYTSKAKVIKKRTSYKNGTYLYNLKFNGLSGRHKSQIQRFIMNNVTAQIKIR